MYKGNYWGTIGITPFIPYELTLIREAVGRILPSDYGKQVWEVSPSVLQMETSEQATKRILKKQGKNNVKL